MKIIRKIAAGLIVFALLFGIDALLAAMGMNSTRDFWTGMWQVPMWLGLLILFMAACGGVGIALYVTIGWAFDELFGE